MRSRYWSSFRLIAPSQLPFCSASAIFACLSAGVTDEDWFMTFAARSAASCASVTFGGSSVFGSQSNSSAANVRIASASGSPSYSEAIALPRPFAGSRPASLKAPARSFSFASASCFYLRFKASRSCFGPSVPSPSVPSSPSTLLPSAMSSSYTPHSAATRIGGMRVTGDRKGFGRHAELSCHFEHVTSRLEP